MVVRREHFFFRHRQFWHRALFCFVSACPSLILAARSTPTRHCCMSTAHIMESGDEVRAMERERGPRWPCRGAGAGGAGDEETLALPRSLSARPWA